MPSIPNNVKNWQVFENNQQIKRFIENEEYFMNTQNDDENHYGGDPLVVAEAVSVERNGKYSNVCASKEIMQLKTILFQKV